jgi:hypothetical protein
MIMRRYGRALLALIAAYAVALQAVLLAVGGPAFGATQFAAVPICSPFGSTVPGHAPPRHGHDCLLATCVAGCCWASHAAPSPDLAVIHAPDLARASAAAADAAPILRLSLTRAHRSRAPPAI